MNLQAMQLEMARLVLFSIALSALGFAITMWVLYLVIKNAVRDGIKESGLVQAQARIRPAPTTGIPDMRAD
jgi:hypothetical protein